MGYTTIYPLTIAKSISYRAGQRNIKNVIGVVIHNTGNNGDTAKNNVHYFSKSGTNPRNAGAHLFVSRDGDIQQSIPFEFSAYSVGDKNGRGSYYGKLTNSNTISIELCDIVSKDISAQQIESVKSILAYLKTICPNIKYIVRHYDITTKSCPARYLNKSKWENLKAAIQGGSYTIIDNVTPETLHVDGYVGELTVRVWQRIMGTVQDGEISGQLQSLRKYHLRFTSSALEYGSGGSQLIKAVQKTLGVDQDGQLGPVTIKAIQDRVGAFPDGYFGEKTAKALQEKLNTRAF